MPQEKNPQSLFFRERLGTLLAKHGITQRELATATKLTPQSISNYMRGTRSLPGAGELLALAKYFGVSMESLLESADNDQEAKEKQATYVPPASAKMHEKAKRMECLVKELGLLIEEIKSPH